MQKKQIIKVLIPLFFGMVIFIWMFGVPFKNRERLYLIPEIDMYVKLLLPHMSSYGYVLLGKESELSLSDGVDYIKKRKSDGSLKLIINPEKDNVLYINDDFNNSTPHSCKYNISLISYEDTIFYTYGSFTGVNKHKLNYPYINITIDGHFRSVYRFNEQGYLLVIDPIMEKNW